MIPQLKEPIHKGHRQRMLAKLAEHGPRVFDTYELLEMILYYVIPQKDTNPIAKRLLAAFGSLDGVLRAEREELEEIEGIGKRSAEFISALGKFTYVNTAKEREELSVFADFTKTGEYLVNALKDESEYSIVLLLLDTNMNLISRREIYRLDLSSGGTKPSAFVDAALESGASIAIIAHSHPHGPLFPSEGDMQSTSLIGASLERLGIHLLESYIISGERYVGYMRNLSRTFSRLDSRIQNPAVLNFLKTKEAAQND